MDHAQELAGGRLQGRAAHEADGGQGRGDLGLAGLGQEGRHRRLGGQDDRLGGHEATGGVVVVGHEAAYVLGLLGLHEAQELGGLELGEVGDQVGGVVGLHGVQDIGGAPGLQPGQECDGVLVAELLEDVGQTLVGQLGGHAHLAVLGQVAHDVGQVGRLEILQSGQQRRGALLVGAGRQARDLLGKHREGLPTAQAQRPRGGALDEQTGHLPVHAAVALNGHVPYGDGSRSVAHGDHPVQQLADDEGLHVALGEAADVHQTGGDDGAGLDRGDPGQGQEDAAPAGDLDDEPDCSRLPTHLQQDDDVMNLAHRVAQGVKDGGTDEAGHKYPAGRARPGVLHKPSLCA